MDTLADFARTDSEYLDVLIVGAGLSGIGAAWHLQDKCPGKSYAILEARETSGGTWDLFRYPGIRSDSDMYTLGYSFRPWKGAKAIADGPSILSYIREVALNSLASLRSRFDVVVCEGAGSPAEINLRAGDLANLGLARAAGLPVLLVGDIDRGGVFAAMHGTVALLEPADQALVAGFLVNKFRGDPELLAPGLRQLVALTGRPVLGVLPWVPGLWLDAEDSLALDPPWSSSPFSSRALKDTSTPCQ